VYTLFDQQDSKGFRLCALDDNRGSMMGGGVLQRSG
jgi:hypothetical protein